MWARRAWSKPALRRRLRRCKSDLRGHESEYHAPCEERGFIPAAECARVEEEVLHDDRYRHPTARYEPIEVEREEELRAFNPHRHRARNPELLVITSNNPGHKQYVVEDTTTGGRAYFSSRAEADGHMTRLRELGRGFRLVSGNGKGRRTTMRRKSRNGKYVRIGGKRRSWKALVRKHGVKKAARIWRKKKKVHTGKRKGRKGRRRGRRKGTRICYTRRRRRKSRR
jgi:hypothetical protein